MQESKSCALPLGDSPTLQGTSPAKGGYRDSNPRPFLYRNFKEALFFFIPYARKSADVLTSTSFGIAVVIA